MRIMPINNNQPSFEARLPKRELNTMVDAALSHDKEAGLPKLYTLLQQLDKMPGEKAELKSWIIRRIPSGIGFASSYENRYQLRVDNKLIEEGSNAFDVLYSAVTSFKTKDGKKIHMPKAVFDPMWWKNRNKSAEDIEKLLRD